MHAIYDYLQRNYKIGPLQLVDGQPAEKPFQEYPKWITDADGKRQIVKDLQHEIRVAGKAPAEGPVDPLQSERDKLAAEGQKVQQALGELDQLKAEMRAQLAELQTARDALNAQPKGGVEVKAPLASTTPPPVTKK